MADELCYCFSLNTFLRSLQLTTLPIISKKLISIVCTKMTINLTDPKQFRSTFNYQTMHCKTMKKVLNVCASPLVDVETVKI